MKMSNIWLIMSLFWVITFIVSVIFGQSNTIWTSLIMFFLTILKSDIEEIKENIKKK